MPNPKLLAATTIAAFTLAAGLGACSGSSSPSSEKATTTAASSDDGGDSSTTADDDTSTTVVATGGGEFCEQLADYINDSSMADVDSTDPEGYRKAIEQTTEQGRDVLSNAPDELSDSIEVLLDAQDQLIAELEKVDYDVTKLSPEAFSAFDSPELEAAGADLEEYSTGTCGIELPQTTAATIPDMTTVTVGN